MTHRVRPPETLVATARGPYSPTGWQRRRMPLPRRLLAFPESTPVTAELGSYERTWSRAESAALAVKVLATGFRCSNSRAAHYFHQGRGD